MPRRHNWIPWACGIILALIFVGFGLTGILGTLKQRLTRSAYVLGPNAPLSAVAKAMSESHAQALGMLDKRLAAESSAENKTGLTVAEAKEWLAVLTGIRNGYVKFEPRGRALALDCSVRIFAKFETDPAPESWIESLPLMNDLFQAALADRRAEISNPALGFVGKLWTWMPGKTLDAREQAILGDWKEALYQPVVRCLGNANPNTRAAAIACLGVLPIDDAASIAVAYVSDPEPDVRMQTLVSFGTRRGALSEESLIPLIYDPEPRIASRALQTLRDRGLDNELIGLCKLIAHPDPNIRVSAIPLLAKHEDIDPLTWVLYLSRDRDGAVRAKAIEFLAERSDVEAHERLTEMSLTDSSDAVRKAATSALDAAGSVALPPLPGSAKLNPKAN